MLIGAVGSCCWGVCIESLDALEKEDGAAELRLALFPHRKNEAQESGPLELLLSGGSECSVLRSESLGDMDLGSLRRKKELLDLGLVKIGVMMASLGSS